VGAQQEDDPSVEPGDGEQIDEVDDAPTLEPAERTEVAPSRPAWADVPGTVDKTLMAGNSSAPLFGFHLEGGAVSRQGIQIPFLAAFLESFRKVFEPLQVLTTGRIPEGNRLPETSAADPLVNAIGATASVTIFFSLSEEELETAEKKGLEIPKLLSVRATGHLGALLDVSSEGDVVDQMSPFGRRISRSYGSMVKLLGENGVTTDWWSDVYGEDIELSAPDAASIANDLLGKEGRERRNFKLDGFMWEAATGKAARRFVRIEAGTRSVKASYDIPLTSAVRDALSHKVSVKIRETAYYRPFEDKPHKRTFELTKILSVGDSAGALAEAEQLEIEGTEKS
jgi:hypothetical protein